MDPYHLSCIQGDHYMDRERGILTYNSGEVYIFDSFIYIPVVLVMPTTIHQTVEQMFSLDDCGILDKLQESMDKTIRMLEEKLPVLIPIERQPSLKDLMNSKGKLTVDGQRSSNLSRPDVQIRKLTHNKVKLGSKRMKRVAPLVLWGGMALMTLATLAVYNRADIEIEKSHTQSLLDNQVTIEEYAKVTKETVNLIIDKQESLIMSVHNLTDKINEIIEDYTCLKRDFSTYMDYLVTWSTVAPNSFMRAVNGALGGRLTIDLLPGDQLQRVMQYYPEFSDTIFQKDPIMLYQSARVKVIKISKNPPMLETIVSVPRVLYPIFGSVYTQKSCPWKVNHTLLTIRDQAQKILSSGTRSWYSMRGCNAVDSTYLCDIREMVHTPEYCLNLDEHPDLTRCPLIRVDHQFDKVVQTPDGIMVCGENTSVHVFTRDALGVLHTRVELLNQPTYYTSGVGDSILINENHYNLRHTDKPVVIQTQAFVHTKLADKDFIHSLDYIGNDKKIDSMRDLPKLRTFQTSHTVSIIALFMMIVSLTSIAIYGWRKKVNKDKRMLGFLMGQVNASTLVQHESELEPIEKKPLSA